ncbi:MAG: DUF695 domain-containing protein [Fimbriimonadaceae bacterium]
MKENFFSTCRETPSGPNFHLALETTPDPSFPNLISVKIPYSGSQNGFPTTGERKKIDHIEDSLTSIIESPQTRFVGRILKPNLSIIYFYSKSSGHPEVTIKTGLFKKESFSLETQPDPEWHFYAANIKPTPLELHMNRSAQLHIVLLENGDDPSKPRVVDIGCTFPTRTALENFLAAATAAGFGHSDPKDWGSPEDPVDPAEDYWCELTKTTSIEPETIAQVCVDVEALCESHGGEFDGWACPVMK